MAKVVPLIGPAMVCQFGFAAFVVICTWKGPLPPGQLNNKELPCGVSVEMSGCCMATEIISVAVLNRPRGSVARTPILFVPVSPTAGVPDRVPSLATVNHAGPLVLEKLNASSGFGSEA